MTIYTLEWINQDGILESRTDNITYLEYIIYAYNITYYVTYENDQFK